MKKNMLTEINNIRRIMGLHLIMEDTKTEIYSLLKKLSSESTSETEKNEIKAILKRANVTDEEIQRLLRGGEQTLTQLTRKIEGNLTVELSDDLEKILIKSGVASEVFRELGAGSGARLIDSVESLYTAMKNGQITMEDYLLRKDTMLDRFDEFFSREEMERALKSMENDVNTKIENARRASEDIVSDIEVDTPIEDIRVNDPSLESFEISTGPIENPDDILLQIFSPNAVKKVKKEFKNYTQKEIRDQFDKWKADKSLSKIQVEKWDKFMENIDKNWWGKLSNKTKVLFIVAVLYGPNVIYMMAKLGVPSDALILIPFVGPLLKPSEEEKQKEEKTQEITDYLLKLENYRVLSKDGKKLSDMDNFYLNKLIDDFGTIQNDLKNKITSKVKSLVDSKKGKVDVYGMYQFGEEVSNEINKILLTVDETKNFKVELIKETDDDYLKPGLKTTLKGLKNLLVMPDVDKRQKTSYEQPKQNNLPTNF
jgi:flagellar hook-basal body complex protein FliE